MVFGKYRKIWVIWGNDIYIKWRKFQCGYVCNNDFGEFWGPDHIFVILSYFWGSQKIASIWPKSVLEVDTSGCQDCQICARSPSKWPHWYPRYILYTARNFPHDRIFDHFLSDSVIFRILGDSAFLPSFFYRSTLSGLQNFMTTRRDKSFRDYVFLLGLMFSFQGFGHPKLSGKYFSPGKSKSPSDSPYFGVGEFDFGDF